MSEAEIRETVEKAIGEYQKEGQLEILTQQVEELEKGLNKLNSHDCVDSIFVVALFLCTFVILYLQDKQINALEKRIGAEKTE